MNKEFFANRFKNNILVTGIIRNGADTIQADIERINSAIKQFNSVKWLVVESDSQDNTLIKLEQLQNNIKNFRYISLGDLRKQLPLRTDRISFCRNSYLEEIKTNSEYKSIDYVIIADLDNLNTLINEEAISSCWESDKWDVCTANQKGPYYDIFALRHPIWSPVNYSESITFYKKLGLSDYDAKFKGLLSKMITIPTQAEWIKVGSAFGGLGIFKKSVVEHMVYKGLDEKGNEICEHVPALLNLTNKGFKVYINPKLINCSYNEHTKHMKYLFFYKLRLNYFPSNLLQKIKKHSS